MAESTLSIEEVATRLQVSTRTIRNYISEGFLGTTKKRGDKRKYCDAIEVEALRREIEEHGTRTLVARKEVRQLELRLSKMEVQMRVVLRILDAQAEPLNLDAQKAGAVLTACVLEQKNGSWEIDELQNWAEIFLRLTEEDFALMAAEETKPYKPFLQLCMTMCVHSIQHADYESSLERQRVHRLLAEGRRRLRIAAVLYAESLGDVPAELRAIKTIDMPGSLVDALEKRVRRIVQKAV